MWNVDKDKKFCPICSFPEDLCICDNLSQDEQQIIITNERRKWGKIVTVLSSSEDFDLNLKEVLEKARKKSKKEKDK